MFEKNTDTAISKMLNVHFIDNSHKDLNISLINSYIQKLPLLATEFSERSQAFIES